MIWPWVFLSVVVFLLVGVSLMSYAYEFVGLRYRKACAKSQLRRFDEMMTRVGRGTITGTPLSPNEQVLRAVCCCDVERPRYRNLYRVPAISPIAFECDATTGTENRLPPTPAVHNTLSSASAASAITSTARDEMGDSLDDVSLREK